MAVDNWNNQGDIISHLALYYRYLKIHYWHQNTPETIWRIIMYNQSRVNYSIVLRLVLQFFSIYIDHINIHILIYITIWSWICFYKRL